MGVYWTLPVNWAGFRDLPVDVDAAAAASRTIRYQRALIRSWVQQSKGELEHEIAFMDVRPDRATDAVEDVLRRAVEQAKLANSGVILLAVDFELELRWRRNLWLRHVADELGLRLELLYPDAILIDGEEFNPAKHFARWRKADAQEMTRLRVEAETALRQALEQVPDGYGRWGKISAWLNGQGVRTIRGGTWTPENVRKLVLRQEAAQFGFSPARRGNAAH